MQVLKSTPLSLWERNVQLAAYSLLIYLPSAVAAAGVNILHGWSPLPSPLTPTSATPNLDSDAHPSPEPDPNPSPERSV